MSIPNEKKNACLKTVEKLSKYKDLEIEIEITWKLKTMTVPVRVGVLGLLIKETENYISKIPGNISLFQAPR